MQTLASAKLQKDTMLNSSSILLLYIASVLAVDYAIAAELLLISILWNGDAWNDVGVTLVSQDQDVSSQLSWGSKLELGWFHNDAADVTTGTRKSSWAHRPTCDDALEIQPQTQLVYNSR